jgi:hypothetical protein
MRIHAKSARVFLFLCLAAALMSAEQKREGAEGNHQGLRKSSARPDPAPIPALSSDDGLAVLGAALDYRHRAEPYRDCSHLVHELYERAGFPYAYASSSDLYSGVNEFRRVTNPQPGDLAVWRGHVGIVVSPVQHSFFSLLRSGPGVDSYDAQYWKRRGHPRFFRYIEAVPTNTPHSPVLNANWKPPVPDNSEESSDDDPVPDTPETLTGRTSTSQNLGQIHVADAPLSRSVVVNAIRPKPDHVREAFLEASKEWEQQLRGRDLFESSPSLIVFDHFEVRKVNIKGNHGWAEVRIDEPVSLVASKAQIHRRSEHQRWSLTRRDSKTWDLAPPPNTVYLTQPAAVRMLATELAQLAKDSPENASKAQQKAQLARLLNTLLEK